MRRKWSSEMLSRALSEAAGPGLVGGGSADLNVAGRLCLVQAAHNDTLFAVSCENEDWALALAFDSQRPRTPEQILEFLESHGAA